MFFNNQVKHNSRRFDVNFKDTVAGLTPLMYAITLEHEDTAREIVQLMAPMLDLGLKCDLDRQTYHLFAPSLFN